MSSTNDPLSNSELWTRLHERKLVLAPDDIDAYRREFSGEVIGKGSPSGHWKERRVLVTGISGFAGSHLAERLLELGAEVIGLVRRHSVPEYRNLSHFIDRVELFEGNLTDLGSLLTLLKKEQPDTIFHLGAQSFVPTSFRAPLETYDTNVLGTANLFEAIRQADSSVEAIQVACSSEEYGRVLPEELPIRETNPLRPQSPYGASKVAVEYLSLTHAQCYGTPMVVTRAFNHTGPRRGIQFVSSVITRQIARLKKGMTKKVVIGNPVAIRDFSDVRDIVDGYMLAAEKGKRGEPYNLGHGRGVSIQDLVRITAAVVGITEVNIEIDKSRFRPADVEVLICDHSKAREAFGYRPRIPITRALEENVDYFLQNPHLLSLERH